MSGDVALASISVILTVLAFIVVAARGVARFAIVKQAGVEDGLAILALLCSLILSILFMTECFFDHDDAELEVESLRTLWASTLITNISIPLAKCGILLQYVRYFLRPRYRHISMSLVAAVALYGAISVVVSIMSCTPISSFWFSSDNPSCINIRAFSLATAIWDLLTSLCILAIPMFAVIRWAQPKGEQLAFNGLYCLGGLACVASCVRIYGLQMGNAIEATSDNVLLWISTTAELNLIILCASLPTLGPLIDRLFPGLLANWSDSGRRPSHSRAWAKITGRESPQGSVELELPPPLNQSRRPSAQSLAASMAASDAPSAISVTTNNRGSAHPGALVHIPEDVEAAGRPLPPRVWLRDSMRPSPQK